MISFIIMMVYVIAGTICLEIQTARGVSPVWAPSGIILGLLVIFGPVITLPAAVAGSFIIYHGSSLPLISVFGLTLSGLLQCTLAYTLLQNTLDRKNIFRTPKNVFTFLSISVFFAPFISSTVAITFLFIGGTANVLNIPELWIGEFTSNALGVLIFTPLILSFSVVRLTLKDFIPAIISICVLSILSYWAFDGMHIKRVAIFPFMLWVTFRFQFRGISAGAMIVLTVAFWRSMNASPVFVSTTQIDLLLIQEFAAMIAITGYFISTLVEAQASAHETEIELNKNLQHIKIAEEALAILDQSIHKSPIGFALIDKDFKYIRVNETLAAINNLPSEFHIGKEMKEIVPKCADKTIEMISTVFETGESFTNLPFNKVRENEPETYVFGLISFYPVKHPTSGEIFAVAVSLQDISELIRTQNLLKENQDRLRFSQEAGKIGSFEWDLRQNKMLWSPELEMIYGMGPGEFSSNPADWKQWIHPEDFDGLVEEIHKVLQGTSECNFECRIITKCNQVKWILSRGKVIKDHEGKNLKLIGINIDITEQKATVQKLRITEANLLHALSVRDEFVAIASHELKTPLQSLKLQTQMYQRNINKNESDIYCPKKVNTMLERNSLQVDRLSRLVDDMLDISRIRTGRFSVKKDLCEIGPLIQDILQRTQEQFIASGSALPIIEHLDSAMGEWDQMRLEQVITNIITNSLRYGLGKPIIISVRNTDEHVHVTVKDNGPGIPEKDQAKIFERYERGTLTKERSGLGLGLFICKQIVDAHDGRIWVESEIGKGSTFHLELPRKVIAAQSLA